MGIIVKRELRCPRAVPKSHDWIGKRPLARGNAVLVEPVAYASGQGHPKPIVIATEFDRPGSPNAGGGNNPGRRNAARVVIRGHMDRVGACEGAKSCCVDVI